MFDQCIKTLTPTVIGHDLFQACMEKWLGYLSGVVVFFSFLFFLYLWQLVGIKGTATGNGWSQLGFWFWSVAINVLRQRM